jgi:hypothetical protein
MFADKSCEMQNLQVVSEEDFSGQGWPPANGTVRVSVAVDAVMI